MLTIVLVIGIEKGEAVGLLMLEVGMDIRMLLLLWMHMENSILKIQFIWRFDSARSIDVPIHFLVLFF